MLMNFDRPLDRRRLLGTSLAAGGLVSLSGCVGAGRGAAFAPRVIGAPQTIAPMRASVDRITDIKVCLRPFRPQGPRLDTEKLGDTLVIHNYGHGGSGWSLSWGSAEVAVAKAAAALPDRVAVVGCGIIGLTSAVMAQRAGMQVTIYTREVFSRTRSVRANGSWTPDSRIALTQPAGEAFGALWERMARFSWKSFRSYLGLPGNPVDFSDQYRLGDAPFTHHEESAPPAGKDDYASTGMPRHSSEFADYADRIADITPNPEMMPTGSTPFAAPYVRRSSNMFFNFSSYGHYLMQEFLENGGKIEIREFHAPGELAQLKEKVVINCPGYAARDLWRDTTLIPVRGQTAWLIPQPEVHYGLYTHNVSALSKADGLMIQSFRVGLGDMEGVGDSSELPDRAESEAAVAVIQKAFTGFRLG
jgi:glycine/D-amino acid oxidase-like deaminating enzyme